MNAKEAREIVLKAKSGVAQPGDDVFWESTYPRAIGFLEALKGEEVKILLDALNKISHVGLDPELGQIVGPEHYEKAWLDCLEIAKEALSKFNEVIK